MASETNNITYFAETNFRNQQKKFGIKRVDRTKHTYIIGKSGMGKTTLLENMVIQDIMRGESVGIVDPHGDFAEKILNFIPENRIKDVIYFAPHDIDWPIAFNVIEKVDPTQRHLVAAGLLGVFKKIWPDVWSARMEYILNNCILALLEYPDSTLLGINRMLSDKEYRKEVVSKITDPVIKAFWTDEFAKYTDRFMTEASAAIQNKVGQFISNPLIRNIIGQTKSGFDLREIMDNKKILIMNLSKGRIGEENSRLIGAMLITKIYLAAMSRVDVAEKDRSDFYLYVDEFQNFATESFKDILSEARKYRLNLILAHQYITQMDEKVADAVFGNVGTLISFRVGAADAEFLEKEFEPEFMVQDLVNLGFAGIYLRLMIDGVPSRPFSATTLPPIKQEEVSCADAIIESSREKYASSRNEVEEEITSWHAPSVSVAEKSSFDSGARPMGASRSLPHAGSFRQAPSGEKEQPEMYEATCSVCGKKTYVPFKPDGKRPIFCKAHRASGGGGAGEVRKEATISPAPINVNPVKTISLKDLEGGRRPASSVSRPAPKMDELRKVLDEVMAKEEEKEEAPKKNILKPGDKIKFE